MLRFQKKRRENPYTITPNLNLPTPNRKYIANNGTPIKFYENCANSNITYIAFLQKIISVWMEGKLATQ